MPCNAPGDIVLAADTAPASLERFDFQPFEAFYFGVVEEFVFEPFLTIFFSGIDLKAFLGITSCAEAMGPQTGLLVDAAIPAFVKLDIAKPFPLSSRLVVVSGIVGIRCVEMNSWYHDASFIIEQIE